MAYDLKTALDELLQPRPGWLGRYATSNAPGALQAGTRITKAKDEPGDVTPLLTLGTVLGSMLHPDKGVCYFIEWDDKPRCAVAVIAWKIREAT